MDNVKLHDLYGIEESRVEYVEQIGTAMSQKFLFQQSKIVTFTHPIVEISLSASQHSVFDSLLISCSPKANSWLQKVKNNCLLRIILYHLHLNASFKEALSFDIQVSGSNMGGVLGGFNRDHCRKGFVYERVTVASLDYAIKNNIKHVHYSLVDKYTKLRLINSLEPCGLYFYSRNPLNRKVFKLTNKFSDVYQLHLLEKQGRSGKMQGKCVKT